MKRPPRTVFDETVAGRANHFRFRLSPDVTIALDVRSKVPGEAMVGGDVELFAVREVAGEMEPYERLLGDAIDGDPTLFTREDAVEASSRIVEPILDGKTPVHAYDPGTWGPSQLGQRLSPSDGRHDSVVTPKKRT